MTGKSYTSGFLPDGSVNFDASQVLFEIKWQRPEDYDLNTGLADPYSVTQKKYNNRLALQSRVYLCKKVISEFKQGRFEQTLEGAIYLFPKPDRTNTANPASATSGLVATANNGRNTTSNAQALPNQTNAETARLARQNATEGRKTNEIIAGRTAFADKAAALGAQGAYQVAQFGSNGSGGAAVGNPSLTRQGITAGAQQVLPAGAPGSPTDGAGGTVGVTESINNGPPKLSSTGFVDRFLNRLAGQKIGDANPTSTTNPAVQKIVKDQ